MLKDDVITGLPDIKVIDVTKAHCLQVLCCLTREAACPNCGGRDLRLKDRKIRCIKGITHSDRPTDLLIEVPKYRCEGCRRYFWQAIPGVYPYSRTSQPFKEEVFLKNIKGISQKQLASDLAMGSASCERYVKEMFACKYRERMNTPCPLYLGIDEHHFGRGKSYVTTLCDLRKHKIYDILPGKAEKNLVGSLMKIQNKNQVRVVVMDLSTAYRSLVQKYFPRALIVSDRFHVIRLVLQSFTSVCQKIDPELKWKRGIPKLMMMNRERHTDLQRKRLDAYLEQNPAIKSLYLFKEEMKGFLMTKNKTRKRLKQEGVIEMFLDYLNQLDQAGFEAMKVLGKTLRSWGTEILRMFTLPFSNGITEGFHRKMKLIQRRAYGFRNFENYRLRVIVLCGHLPEAGL